MHKQAKRVTSIVTDNALIIVNLIPLLGIILFNWTPESILFIYWAENLIIGIYTIPKILKLKDYKKHNKIIVAIMFSAHYSIFIVMHFFLIFFISAILGSKTTTLLAHEIAIPLIVTVIPFAMSHGISYKENYIGKKEYTFRSIKDITTRPYERTLLMNLLIIAGGFIAIALGRIWIVIIFMLLKMPVDIVAHRKEHRV